MKISTRNTLLALALAGASASFAQNIPCFSNDIVQPDGTIISMKKEMPTRAVPKLEDHKFDNADGHDLREVHTDRELRACVILIEFQEQEFTISDDPKTLFSRMLNEPGFKDYGCTGSVFDYYNSVSTGQFSPKFDVYGPVKVSKRHQDYADYNIGETFELEGYTYKVYGGGRAMQEAIELLDDQIDFSQYDSNGDGMVDFVYAFHAGQGATTGGSKYTTIWPHAYTLNAAIGRQLEKDGVIINRYVMSCELSNRTLMGPGMMCHEFGHILGLPDYYDTANNNGQPSKCFTPGTFDNMDGGNYNNNSHTPPTFSGYERYALEWMLPVTLDGAADLTIIPLTSRNFAYKVPTRQPQEYYMLEARAPHSYDQYIEGHGLAVWHIDFDLKKWQDNVVNNDADHQRIDLIEADYNLTTGSRAGDLFPGNKGIHEFCSYSQPSFIDWQKRDLGLELTNIVSHPDGTVSLKATGNKKAVGFDLATPQPKLERVNGTTADISWPKVDGATGYMISVYNLNSLENNYYREFLDGYLFRELGDKTYSRIEGLKEGVSYGATVYALSDKNASRSAQPICFSALGSEFEKAVANVYTSRDEEGNLVLGWDKVADASHYLVTVATREPGEAAETVIVDFTGSALPEGWQSDCEFISRNKYFGEAAPSLQFPVHGSSLSTATFDREIRSLTMWNKISFSEENVAIDIYGTDRYGRSHFIGQITGFSTSGEQITVDIPAGYHSLTLRYPCEYTDLFIYIDDLKIALADGPVDTPVSGYDRRKETAESLILNGLENDKEYVAYIHPVKGETEGLRSNALLFVPSAATTGIVDIESDLEAAAPTFDPNAPYSVYDLTGAFIGSSLDNLPAGIHILRQGSLAKKILRK